MYFDCGVWVHEISQSNGWWRCCIRKHFLYSFSICRFSVFYLPRLILLFEQMVLWRVNYKHGTLVRGYCLSTMSCRVNDLSWYNTSLYLWCRMSWILFTDSVHSVHYWGCRLLLLTRKVGDPLEHEVIGWKNISQLIAVEYPFPQFFGFQNLTINGRCKKWTVRNAWIWLWYMKMLGIWKQRLWGRFILNWLLDCAR